MPPKKPKAGDGPKPAPLPAKVLHVAALYAMNGTPLKPSLVLILGLIAEAFERKDGNGHPGYENLSLWSGIGLRQVRKLVDELEALGLVSINRRTGRGHANEIRLTNAVLLAPTLKQLMKCLKVDGERRVPGPPFTASADSERRVYRPPFTTQKGGSTGPRKEGLQTPPSPVPLKTDPLSTETETENPPFLCSPDGERPPEGGLHASPDGDVPTPPATRKEQLAQMMSFSRPYVPPPPDVEAASRAKLAEQARALRDGVDPDTWVFEEETALAARWLWDTVKTEQHNAVSPENHATWLVPTEGVRLTEAVDKLGGRIWPVLVVRVPSEDHRHWLRGAQGESIRETFGLRFPGVQGVRFEEAA